MQHRWNSYIRGGGGGLFKQDVTMIAANIHLVPTTSTGLPRLLLTILGDRDCCSLFGTGGTLT